MTKSKMAKQGLDGITFECSINNEHVGEIKLPEEKLTNQVQNVIVSIKCIGEKIIVYVNPAHAIRDRNIEPFSFADISRLNEVRSQAIGFITKYIKKYIPGMNIRPFLQTLKVKSVECNLTLPCVKNAVSSDVIHLIDMSLDRTVVFRKRKVTSTCEKFNTSCLYTKPKEYRIKIYDKTDEQRTHGNLHVASRLLRIEVVFIDRSLKRIYGDKRTLNNILSEQGITNLCEHYQKVLAEEIIDKHVKTYLTACKNKLVESLTLSERKHAIADTVARYKDLIVDIDVLREALKRWYKLDYVSKTKRNSRTKSNISQYRQKELGLPEDILKTIKAFRVAAGK